MAPKLDTVRAVLLAQGAYYVVTGVAPFASRRAFEAVTGRKREWWLVQTVGALVTPVGGGLVGAALRDRVTPELAMIAGGCAGGLAAVDIVHTVRGRLGAVYLADAALELAFVTALACGATCRRDPRGPSRLRTARSGRSSRSDPRPRARGR